MSAVPAPTPAAAPRSRLFRVALVLALVGMTSIVAAYVTAAVSSTGPALLLYLLSMLLPAGMVVAALALATDYRRNR